MANKRTASGGMNIAYDIAEGIMPAPKATNDSFGHLIDANNYVTLNTNQHIPSLKTFENGVSVGPWKLQHNNKPDLIFSVTGTDRYSMASTAFSPLRNRQQNLGEPSYMWNYIYATKISDGTKEIDVSELVFGGDVVHKIGDEIIKGVKTFDDGILFEESDAWGISQPAAYADLRINFNGEQKYYFSNHAFMGPGKDLGGFPAEYQGWKNLYLTGVLSDGTNSLSIADIQSKLTFDTVPTANSTNPVTSGGIKTALDTKQNVITDLEQIRSGAALGATALQSVPSEYVTDTELASAIAYKEDTSNKVALGPTNTNTQYPTASSVWNECVNLREVAEGKTNSFSVDTDTSGNSAFKSDDEIITATSFVDVNGNTINVSDLNVGDLVFTLNTNTNKYKDRWLIDKTLGTWGLIDADTPNLSGYATKTELSESIENLAQPYDSTVIYSIGDKVIYNDKLYTCLVNMSAAESWDSTHWVQITVAGSFFDLSKAQVISAATTFVGNNTLFFKRSENSTYTYSISPASDYVLEFKRNTANLLRWTNADGWVFYYNAIPNATNALDLGTATLAWKDLYLSGSLIFKGTTYDANIVNDNNRVRIKYGGADRLVIGNGDFIISNSPTPNTTNFLDLGSSSKQWKDAYFSGNVYAQNTFNVINASDIVNNTLTQEQYDLITNGKPTIIKGAFLSGYENYVLMPPLERTNDFVFEAHYATGYPALVIGVVKVSKSTKVISLDATKYFRLEQVDSLNTNKINGKVIPAYQSDTTKQYKLVQQVGGNLAWIEDDTYATSADIQNLF